MNNLFKYTLLLLVIVSIVLWYFGRNPENSKPENIAREFENNGLHSPSADINSVVRASRRAEDENFSNKIDGCFQTISRDLCQSKEWAILDAIESDKIPKNISSTRLIEILIDFSNNKCSTFRKNNIDKLLNIEINQDNFRSFPSNYDVILGDSPGMVYLALFRKAIEELKIMPKDKVESLRKALFFALNSHINNASMLIDIGVSAASLAELGRADLISKSEYDQVIALITEFEDARKLFVQRNKAASARYPSDIFKLPFPKMIEELGYTGVKDIIYGQLKYENEVTKEFRAKLNRIMQSITDKGL